MRSYTLNSLCNGWRGFSRLILLICVVAGFVIPVAAQVGMDTESLLFRSYGDNPQGAVARIQEPTPKPTVDMPTPPKKPVIAAAVPSADAQELSELALPEGMKLAPVPIARPGTTDAPLQEEDRVEMPVDASVETAIAAPEDESYTPPPAPENVQDVIETLIEATDAAMLPPRKPGQDRVEEESDSSQVEEVVRRVPIPMPKPQIREHPREQAAQLPLHKDMDDIYARNRQDERSAGLRASPAPSISGNVLPKPSGRKENVVIKTRNGIEWLFEVEMAKTPDQHQQGLMFRTSLAEESGMLFVYNPPQRVTMWMKNTKIPLDMIFIANGGRIVKIHESARPGDTRGVSSGRAVRAVLEINGGLARELGIREGDQVIHRYVRS